MRLAPSLRTCFAAVVALSTVACSELATSSNEVDTTATLARRDPPPRPTPPTGGGGGTNTVTWDGSGATGTGPSFELTTPPRCRVLAGEPYLQWALNVGGSSAATITIDDNPPVAMTSLSRSYFEYRQTFEAGFVEPKIVSASFGGRDGGTLTLYYGCLGWPSFSIVYPQALAETNALFGFANTAPGLCAQTKTVLFKDYDGGTVRVCPENGTLTNLVLTLPEGFELTDSGGTQCTTPEGQPGSWYCLLTEQNVVMTVSSPPPPPVIPFVSFVYPPELRTQQNSASFTVYQYGECDRGATVQFYDYRDGYYDLCDQRQDYNVVLELLPGLTVSASGTTSCSLVDEENAVSTCLVTEANTVITVGGGLPSFTVDYPTELASTAASYEYLTSNCSGNQTRYFSTSYSSAAYVCPSVSNQVVITLVPGFSVSGTTGGATCFTEGSDIWRCTVTAPGAVISVGIGDE